MNSLKTLFSISILFLVIVMLNSCASSSEPAKETAEQLFLKQLAGTWNTSVVTYDGVDVTKSFPSMRITLSEDKSIQVTNPVAPIWKATGTFVLEPIGSSFQLKRNDGLLISVESSTSTKLVLTFLFDASTLTGRTESVVGNFKFDLNK